MVRVTPVSIVYTVLLLILIFTLTLPAANYYTNGTSLFRTLNDSYTNINSNFTSKVYSPTYSSTFNSSSGLKASMSLQLFSGLAFMFGAMYQVTVAAFQGIPMIGTVLGSVIQYAPLPGGEMTTLIGLAGLLITGSAFLLLWFAIASWTKVEP